MSLAVIQTGGKQYKVKASEILKIEKLENDKPESKIEFNQVLAYGDDKTNEVGSPLVQGAKVEAELVKNGKNRTDIAYKLFMRKKYKRAILELNEFIERFPALPSTPYAYYLRGGIAEEKSTSILDEIITDSAQRDVQSVRESYGYFVLLIDTFPNSK